ncbi:coiled-coil domain-containing protein 43-like [Artemia franciscana]|uniref:coiled-coil domain-containing protein 43-like n=1 Tax=Artemia franciscana TaxID=6661 RepID=UPI0032DB9C09
MGTLEDFQIWLTPKLQELSVDESVFGSYITGILESSDSNSEKLEALHDVLADVVENLDIDKVCDEIISQWDVLMEVSQLKEEKKPLFDVDDRIAKIMEKQAQSVVSVKSYTEEEKQLKKSILAQYGEISDGEITESEEEHEGKEDAAPDLAKNTNLEDVLRIEKDKKDKLRQEAFKKKEKDKEDREKQKKTQEERKDKEKKRTQKGEKRR